MSKVTTIIDIGSNSMRMVVLQKSSRFSPDFRKSTTNTHNKL